MCSNEEGESLKEDIKYFEEKLSKIEKKVNIWKITDIEKKLLHLKYKQITNR